MHARAAVCALPSKYRQVDVKPSGWNSAVIEKQASTVAINSVSGDDGPVYLETYSTINSQGPSDHWCLCVVKL